MNTHDTDPASGNSKASRTYLIPTESLLNLRRTLHLFQDDIDLDDAKLLLQLVEEELVIRASQGGSTHLK